MFKSFSQKVNSKFDELSKGNLFEVDAPDLYKVYLESFPEGTNPIYITNTEHDCSCCKSFIRNAGNVVSINNGKYESIFDINDLDYPYDVVAKSMVEYLKTCDIKSVFASKLESIGKEYTLSDTRKWDHFYCTVPSRHLFGSTAEYKGDMQTRFNVFKRGVETISKDSIDTVLELIDQAVLYKGDEFKQKLLDFKLLLNNYNGSDVFLWENLYNHSSAIRNSVIGTLLTDISEGMDTESAVKSFEQKVAPANYKRPKALITQRMIDSALKDIDKLGYRESLSRRHAEISDISVNDVLFADRSITPLMRDSLKDVLMTQAKPDKSKFTKDVGIDSFINYILPTASSIEILFSNKHTSNLVSMTAQINSAAKNLFKWNNGFAWSYNGDVTDSIKERVRKAGGNVDSKLRISLSWFNVDDLDIHCVDPSGRVINYTNKSGVLDVDMNINRDTAKTDAVENLSWHNPINGNYRIKVDNFTKRTKNDVGFEIEVATENDSYTYTYPLEVSGVKDYLNVSYTDGVVSVTALNQNISDIGKSREVWNLSTEKFVKVSAVCLSPNYWGDNKSGNKHYMFIMDNCKNPDSVRGIYNEYLNEKLHKHKKVLEVLGSKTKSEYTNEQLSGLGFSSTVRNEVQIKVDGGQIFNVKF